MSPGELWICFVLVKFEIVEDELKVLLEGYASETERRGVEVILAKALLVREIKLEINRRDGEDDRDT